MAENTLQPKQPSLVRMVGIDKPQLNFPTGASPMTEAPQVQDTAFARIQDAQKAVDSMFDIQRGNLQSQANLQQTYAQTAAAKGKPQWVQDFANLGDTIMQGVQIVKRQDAAIAEAEARRQAELNEAATIEQQKVIAETQAKDKAAREQYESELKINRDTVASMATSRIDNLILNMGQLIRSNGEETGVLQTKREADEYLESIKGQVDAETWQKLHSKIYSALGEVDSTLTSRGIEQGKQIRSAIADQQLAVYRDRSTDIFIALDVATTPEEIDTAIGNLQGIFTAINQDPSLTSVEKMEIQTNILNFASEKKLGNATTQARVTQSVNANREYSSQFAQLNQMRDEGIITENQYRTAINELNLAFGNQIPGLKREQLLTSDEQRKMALDIAETQERLYEAAKKVANREAIAQLETVDKQTVGLTAFQILESPHLRTQIELGDNVQAKQALELADNFTKESERVRGLQTEKAKLQVTMLSLAGKIDPARRGQQRQYDPLTGAFVAVEGVPTASATPEEYAALENRMRLIDQDIAKVTQFWSGYGLNALDPRDKSFLKTREQLESTLQGIQQSSGLVPASTLPPESPFNRVTGNGSPALPPVASLKRVQSGGVALTLPIAKSGGGGLSGRDYGNHPHPIRGGVRFHSGQDINGLPRGAPIHTIAGGTVVFSGNSDPNGYGNTVVVQTPNGHFEQYSHNDSNTVKKGDRVAPGQVIAKVGSTGGSTGDHIHMTVWRPGMFTGSLSANESNTIDPVLYMSGNFPQARSVYGAGSPSNTPTSAGGSTTGRMPAGLHPMVIAALVRDGVDPTRLTRQQYTADPYTGVAAPTQSVTGGRIPSYTVKGLTINRADYPSKNDPDANYGYSALAKDAPFRRKIAEVADYLGMPAVWLVDVMHFESGGFQPGITNSIGATGLIQFMPATAQGLGTSTAALRRMGRVEQMEWVKKYFEPIKGKINSPGDVLAYIFGGYGLYSKPEARRNGIGDGNIQYGQYKRRLGNSTGRSYAFPI